MRNKIEAGLQKINYYIRTPEGQNELGKETAQNALRTLGILLTIGTIHSCLNIAEGGVGISEQNKQSRDGITYTVRPGDNLFRIALEWGADYNCLARVNGIEDPRLIHSGQEIKKSSECQISNK